MYRFGCGASFCEVKGFADVGELEWKCSDGGYEECEEADGDAHLVCFCLLGGFEEVPAERYPKICREGLKLSLLVRGSIRRL